MYLSKKVSTKSQYLNDQFWKKYSFSKSVTQDHIYHNIITSGFTNIYVKNSKKYGPIVQGLSSKKIQNKNIDHEVQNLFKQRSVTSFLIINAKHCYRRLVDGHVD